MLGALAARVPIRLGTAVMVQYFRSPMSLAGTAVAVSELMQGRTLDIALARGKKLHDKRDKIKERSWDREKARLLREKG